ncbi:HAD-IB family hydrolase [Phenylobacterium sp.]|uniref:HAD-IB family hydrolase n=1 Tax=Phenylobacterium sp. TaxID=1871053 RepID=UPI00286CAAA2|nr:HAD-IB family hydrolase [Phenylobacterium sp.]
MGRRNLRSIGASTNQSLDEQIDDAGVVAFDFDGTLTIRDSFTAFLKWRAGKRRYDQGMVRLAPAALAYLGHRNRGRIKAAAVREFLAGASREEIENDARAFAEIMAPRLLRPDAVATWRRWRQRRAKLVIVTASPDIVVAPFARGLGADLLIGTALAFDDQDRATGAFSTANCRGPEKVRRLRETFGADLRLQAAYGDTSGDREMLQIAEETGYRVFTERP